MRTARIDQLPYEAESVGAYDWIEVVVNGETFSRKAQAQALPYAQKNGSAAEWFEASGLTADGGAWLGPTTPQVYFYSPALDWSILVDGYKFVIGSEDYVNGSWTGKLVIDRGVNPATLKFLGNEVLTSASTIDADTLGGSSASAFALASHEHSTFSNATALTGATVYSQITTSKGIVTGLTTRALTASDLPAHTHSYLPLTGGTVSGNITAGELYGSSFKAVSPNTSYISLGTSAQGIIWLNAVNGVYCVKPGGGYADLKAGDIYSFDVKHVSDQRLKQDIVSRAGSGLDAIRALPDGAIADFSFIANPGARQTGFIAQAIAQAMPEAVCELPPEPSTGQESELGIEAMSAQAEEPLLGVSIGAILALAVDAIRSLDAELEDLRARVAQGGL